MTTKRIKRLPARCSLLRHLTGPQDSSGKTNNMIGRSDSTSLASCGRQLTPWSFASAGHMMCPGPAPATMTTSLSEKARLSLSLSLCSVKCLSVGRRTLSQKEALFPSLQERPFVFLARLSEAD
ncbi:unnamed protein product [Musa acuminata subsp. malaccensis]|uniref:(wild Malaysian banana) hypothetical protein n=1 Tax=Musa acuminata subsp. malaccensis TaxID=214687 RepID=A0A804J3K2_MUSAM|nr:unnamed protein product [Musa acuminata subsp. malaccensis]